MCRTAATKIGVAQVAIRKSFRAGDYSLRGAVFGQNGGEEFQPVWWHRVTATNWPQNGAAPPDAFRRKPNGGTPLELLSGQSIPLRIPDRPLGERKSRLGGQPQGAIDAVEAGLAAEDGEALEHAGAVGLAGYGYAERVDDLADLDLLALDEIVQ